MIYLAEVIAAARGTPGKITYGSGGNGSISHIVGESFKKEAGVDPLHVTYKGNGLAMADLLAGNIDLVFDGFSTAGQHHKSGAMRILATHGRRHPDYMDVPTFAEAGLANCEAYTWNCLFAAKATPRALIERLNRELNAALAQPDIVRRIAAFSAAQRSRWIPAVRAMNIKVE